MKTCMAPNRDRLRSAALPTHVLQPHGFVVAHPLPSRRDVASTASNIQSVRLPCLQTKSLHHDGAPFKVVQQQGTDSLEKPEALYVRAGNKTSQSCACVTSEERWCSVLQGWKILHKTVVGPLWSLYTSGMRCKLILATVL